MTTQHVERNFLLNFYREENILLVCFFLPLKSDKYVWHLQPSFSTWRLLAFVPVILSTVTTQGRALRLDRRHRGCDFHSGHLVISSTPGSRVIAADGGVDWSAAVQSVISSVLKEQSRGRSQDGRGIGQGDHFLSYKFIERTIERWTTSTKQLLIASTGHQAPRKAPHCLRTEVVQNIKDKKGRQKS